jgi:TRAP-type C4-dicarboxylate transport system permease small subunit
MKVIKRLDDALALVEIAVVLVSFTLLVLLIIIDILSRNIFHFAAHGYFEAGPHLVLWLALMGASLGLKRQRHIRLELVLRHCSRPIRKGAAVIVGIFGAAVMTILFVASVQFVGNEIEMFGSTGRWSLIFPVFFGLAAFRYLVSPMVATDRKKAVEIAEKDGIIE